MISHNPDKNVLPVQMKNANGEKSQKKSHNPDKIVLPVQMKNANGEKSQKKPNGNHQSLVKTPKVAFPASRSPQVSSGPIVKTPPTS